MRCSLGIVIALASVASADDARDAILQAAPSCEPTRVHCFAIRLHVVDDNGFVATPAWLATELAGVNRRFALLDVGFQIAQVDALPAAFAHVENREQRDAIAGDRLGVSAVDVFVVAKLDNIDEAGSIYGVAWHRPDDDRTYAIVSTEALERTLAHELGHLFGLSHSSYVSIMNPDLPPLDDRTFADEEVATMRHRLARLLRDKVVADVPARL